jgi:hypothetical protein
VADINRNARPTSSESAGYGVYLSVNIVAAEAMLDITASENSSILRQDHTAHLGRADDVCFLPNIPREFGQAASWVAMSSTTLATAN